MAQWKADLAQLTAVQSQQVVPLVDYFFDRESKYFVYEFQESGSLRQFLTDAELSHKLEPNHVSLFILFSLSLTPLRFSLKS